MNREGHDKVNFFVGPEVEHTPAFSKKTLFVVGKQKLEDIQKLAKEHKAPHIFMGANHSFSSESRDPYWDHVITALLDQGFWVTLDYQAHEHNEVLKMLNPGIWQCRTFVPLLGVRIPKIQTSSPNLTVKIDDIDFKATNPGVWCLHFHEVTDSNRFTDWQDYGTDEVITLDKEPEVVYADFDPPKMNFNKLKEKFESKIEKTTSESLDESMPEDNNEVKNDPLLGLDTSEKSSPEESAESKEVTLDDAVAAYADTESSTKKKGKK